MSGRGWSEDDLDFREICRMSLFDWRGLVHIKDEHLKRVYEQVLVYDPTLSHIWTIQNVIKSLFPSPNLPYQLRGMISGDFVELSCCDIPQSSDHTPIHAISQSSGAANAHTMLKIIHWTGVKYNYRHTLNSKTLQEVRTPSPRIHTCWYLVNLV